MPPPNNQIAWKGRIHTHTAIEHVLRSCLAHFPQMTNRNSNTLTTFLTHVRPFIADKRTNPVKKAWLLASKHLTHSSRNADDLESMMVAREIIEAAEIVLDDVVALRARCSTKKLRRKTEKLGRRLSEVKVVAERALDDLSGADSVGAEGDGGEEEDEEGDGGERATVLERMGSLKVDDADDGEDDAMVDDEQ